MPDRGRTVRRPDSTSRYAPDLGRGAVRLAVPQDDDDGVTLLLLSLTAGVAIGYARGGSLFGLVRVPMRRNRLLLTALTLYVLGVLGGWVWEPLLGLLSALCWLTVALYAWVNRAVPGAALVALGLAANGLVLLLNGVVPISTDAAARAGADRVAAIGTSAREPIGPDTRLPWLGKTVPVAFPPRPEVVSPGDVAMAAGLALVVSQAMARTAGRPAHSSEAADEVTDGAREHETIDDAGISAEPSRSAAS